MYIKKIYDSKKKKIKVSSRKCKLMADISMQRFRNNKYQLIIKYKRIVISKSSEKYIKLNIL